MRRLTIRFTQLIRYAALAGLLFSLVGGIAIQGVRADCYDDGSFWASMNQVWVAFSAKKEKPLVIAAWMARTPDQRARGFQGVCPALVTKRSLLFSFPAPVHANFHMTDVEVPLDIAFIDGSKKVIEIQRMTQQESRQLIRYYRSNVEIQFALETVAGRLDRLRLNPSLWRMGISNRNQ